MEEFRSCSLVSEILEKQRHLGYLQSNQHVILLRLFIVTFYLEIVQTHKKYET